MEPEGHVPLPLPELAMDSTSTGGRYFRWQDYSVFALMLIVSSLIGLYHGWKFNQKVRNKARDTESASENESTNASNEFLTGGGRMGTVPVAISMLASFLSSITLMGQPAEVYLFGPQLWLFGVASFLAIPVVNYVMIPFFHKLRLTSAYEYFGIRFSRQVQLLASLLFSVQMIIYLALVLYAPALALHQVTGINTLVVVSAMYVVVIFYTTVGGMKAVVWTDTFQVSVLYIAMVAVLVKGTMDIGGVSVVWERNVAGGRATFFDWSFDLTDRYTVWSTFIGAAMLHASVYGANQLQVQRYFTVATVEQAQKMIWINSFGWTAVVILTVYAGMVIFAKYAGCDPLQLKSITSPDQLFPLFVMDISDQLPGFPGLFVAGIFSAGLSTVSTGLNSLAAIWYSELSGTRFREGEHSGGRVVKVLAFGFGLLSFFLVFAVPYMGGLAPVAMALSSFFSGSLFGLFMLGMYVPFSNSVGASAGLIVGVGTVGWMTIGAQYAVDHGLLVHPALPLSAESCLANTTASGLFTTTEMPTGFPVTARLEGEYAYAIYRVSFLWYSLLSLIITVTVGVVVSAITAQVKRSFGIKMSASSSGQSTPETVRDTTPRAFWTATPTTVITDTKTDLPSKFLVREGHKDGRSLHLSLNGRPNPNPREP